MSSPAVVKAGIAGMSPEQTGRVREAEQRRAAAIVGVRDLDFWDFPDSNIRNTCRLRTTIADTLAQLKPDVALTVYDGPEFAPGVPNQRDHVEFAAAVLAAYDSLTDPPRWLFAAGPGGTYLETVESFIDVAVEALAAHQTYLLRLDPHKPVVEHAREVVDMTTQVDSGGHRTVGFILKRNGYQVGPGTI